MERDDLLQLRGSHNPYDPYERDNSYERVNMQQKQYDPSAQLKTLFSQHDPQLYFHKAPGTNKTLPNLNRDN